MPRIAALRDVSHEYLVAEAVIQPERPRFEGIAVDLGLLNRAAADWRARLARAEVIAAFLGARAAGIDWQDIVRLTRLAASEVCLEEARKRWPQS